jgi:hypothetical protein
MENILYNISQVLGITIIHSLWQGILSYLILRTAFIIIPSLSAEKKYNLSIAAMLSVFGCFVYTLYYELHTYNWVNLKSLNSLPLLPYISLPGNSWHFIANQSAYNTIAGYMPYISILYIAGLMANLLKLSWEWNKIRLIKQSFIPAAQMQQYINAFSKKLCISKHIELKFSELIDVPCMIGFFKPLILLPVSLATYLSACEIEAILLHELAHIKRNDYLVNMLQQIIAVILFFNPFAQLINRVINQERENGCDDLVVEKTRNPLIYAKALLKLEETRGAKLQLALSAIGKKYHLLNRIERIMKTKKPVSNIRHLLIAILLLSGSLGSIAWFNPKVAEAKTSSKVAKSSVTESPANVIKKTPQGLKISNIYTFQDSNKYSLLNDTSKHSHKDKVVIVDKNGMKKEYDDIEEMSPAEKAAFFKQHPDVKLMLDSLKTFYLSPEWKAQMLAMKKQGEEMKKQFDNPEWRAQMEAMKRQGEEMKKQFDSPEWKAQMEAMKRQGEEMRKQFDNPEWKAQMLAMQKQGEEMKKQFDSPEWRAQMEAMKRQGEEMKKQFDSPEWRAQMEAMKKQAKEMVKEFNGPEWKNRKWILKDSVNGVGIYVPEKLKKDEKPTKPVKKEDQ